MKKNQGITLIALIITIIVMLILVAVTIDVAIDGKLFDTAKDAVGQTNNKVGEEQNRVDELMGELENVYNPPDGGDPPETIQPGEKADTTTEYEDTNGDKAVIPGDFTVSGVPEESTIEDGLVIYLIPEGETVDWEDPTEVANAQKTYDQFVWIPISHEQINNMYICQAKTGSKVESNLKCTLYY